MTGRLLPILFIVIAAGIFFMYINPTYNQKVVPLQDEIKQYNSTLAAASDFDKKEAELAKDRSAISNDAIARIQSYLPDGVDNVQLILDMNALAARSGVQLSNFDIQTADGSAPQGGSSSNGPLGANGPQTVDSLDLTVKAVGTYNAFRQFLSGVEGSLRPLDLVQLNVTTTPTGVYNYDMTFRIYWLH